DFGELRENAPLADLLAYHASLHAQTLRDFAGLTDAQLNSPSLWWEEIEYDLVHRLLRMEAHLRQHMIQAEKTLAALDHPLTEARRLLRLLYRALAGVEAALLGAPAAAEDDLANLVAALTARAADVAATVTQARALLQAVSADDATAVSGILSAQPTLANACSQAGLSAVITAAYMQRRQALAALLAAGPRLSVHDAAAVGDLARVQELVGAWPGYANQMARDGFSPLQLACFFNQEAVALWLIAHGADVCAVAQNAQRIQPLHAVATNGNLAIVQALLDHGADVNAAQAQDFTALHTAADNGDAPLAELLLAHGANPAAPDADGRSPRDHALARGHTAVANLLVAG
ncbi:MAG: ankyrin repeat domain-containing protein, partial [Anaerolineales bacterium]|nr:ankyrin repeat domain-containing protein [Anaerolineales bacterium]